MMGMITALLRAGSSGSFEKGRVEGRNSQSSQEAAQVEDCNVLVYGKSKGIRRKEQIQELGRKNVQRLANMLLICKEMRVL